MLDWARDGEQQSQEKACYDLNENCRASCREDTYKRPASMWNGGLTQYAAHGSAVFHVRWVYNVCPNVVQRIVYECEMEYDEGEECVMGFDEKEDKEYQ